MRKKFLLISFVLSFFALYGAKLPDGGGYSGPYTYHIDSEFYYVEADALYDEPLAYFGKSKFSAFVQSGFNACTDLGMDADGCCVYCAEQSNNLTEYQYCVFGVADDNDQACAHNDSYSLVSCPVHSETYQPLGGTDEANINCTVPVGGNVVLLLVFALPYAIVRWRKRKFKN